MIESLTKKDLRLVLLGAGCSKCDGLGKSAGWLPIISLCRWVLHPIGPSCFRRPFRRRRLASARFLIVRVRFPISGSVEVLYPKDFVAEMHGDGRGVCRKK